MNRKIKQILAIVCIVLLLSLYIVTLILAVCGNENTTGWFMACIFATVFVPVMMYVYIWIYNLVKKDAAEAGKLGSKKKDAAEARGLGGKSEED